MKNLICTLVGSSLALGTLAYADPASAQFRGLRDAVRDVKKATDDAKEVADTAEDVAETVSGNRRNTRRSRGGSSGGFANRGSTSNSPRTAAAPAHVGGAAPAPSRLSGQLSCQSLGIGNAFIGRDGNYTFSKGISTETRGRYYRPPECEAHRWLYVRRSCCWRYSVCRIR